MVEKDSSMEKNDVWFELHKCILYAKMFLIGSNDLSLCYVETHMICFAD